MDDNQWQNVNDQGTQRLKVDGGWLYKQETSKGLAMSFVPDVDLKRYKAHLRDAYNQGFADGLNEGKVHKQMMSE